MPVSVLCIFKFENPWHIQGVNWVTGKKGKDLF